MSVKSVLVTGANAGVGYEACKQLAKIGCGRVILGCRNAEKAAAAVEKLNKEVGAAQSPFEVLILDLQDLKSVRKAVAALTGSIDGLVMNAGGFSDDAYRMDSCGCLSVFTFNVVGNAVLVEELIDSGKLEKGGRVVYSSTEGIRGVSMVLNPMQNPCKGLYPKYKVYDADELAKHMTGETKQTDVIMLMCYAKSIGTLYIASLARKHPDFTMYSISPGGCMGTEFMSQKSAPDWMVKMFSNTPECMLAGMMHKKENGAKRYLDGLAGLGESGGFFASPFWPIKKIKGTMVDQARTWKMGSDHVLQDAAYEAAHRFMA